MQEEPRKLRCKRCNEEEAGFSLSSPGLKISEDTGYCDWCWKRELSSLERGVIERRIQTQQALKGRPRVLERLDCMIATTQGAETWAISEQLGIVSGECAYGMNMLREFANSLRDLFGGRSKQFQDLMKQSRIVAIEEMKLEAAELGADAVVAVDLDYSEIGSGSGAMMICIANGTAVKLHKPEGKQSNLAASDYQNRKLPPSLPS